MGGWGRTGLFLALLAKVCGVDQPVTYVRENYSAGRRDRAQIGYVKDFDVSGLQRWLFWQAWKNGCSPVRASLQSYSDPRRCRLQLIADGGGFSLASVRS